VAHESRHSQLEPDENSLAFISNAALLPTMNGVRIALEIKRMIVPDTGLMCADVAEANDVVDAILDRLGREARSAEDDAGP